MPLPQTYSLFLHLWLWKLAMYLLLNDWRENVLIHCWALLNIQMNLTSFWILYISSLVLSALYRCFIVQLKLRLGLLVVFIVYFIVILVSLFTFFKLSYRMLKNPKRKFWPRMLMNESRKSISFNHPYSLCTFSPSKIPSPRISIERSHTYPGSFVHFSSAGIYMLLWSHTYALGNVGSPWKPQEVSRDDISYDIRTSLKMSEQTANLTFGGMYYLMQDNAASVKITCWWPWVLIAVFGTINVLSNCSLSNSGMQNLI